jgi:peptidylprolyl isomerase
MKIVRPGAGREHPADNDCVKVRFSAWRRDGTLFSSSTDDAPVGQCLRTAMTGVADGLKAMVVGEAARLWVPARLTVKTDDDDVAAAPADLTFDLELVDIVRAPATPADLAAPPPSAVRLPSGLAMRVLEKGSGIEHPSAGSRVTMDFSGWRTDGTLFESTAMGGHPAVFAVRELIPGWREGIFRMVVGEKARLWIPPALAYGEKPRRRGVPAGPLVYDVQLVALER